MGGGHRFSASWDADSMRPLPSVPRSISVFGSFFDGESSIYLTIGRLNRIWMGDAEIFRRIARKIREITTEVLIQYSRRKSFETLLSNDRLESQGGPQSGAVGRSGGTT